MRPLRLELAGFGAFRDPIEVDFSDVDLVALVGPTGSGKSTIIDAITFALYGSVARYDDNKLVGAAINTLSNEARVLLEFEVAGVAYTAVRVVRRTDGGGTTREARLERGDEVLASGARELTPAVQKLLGLDFAQFTKTVVLPQGRFAEFLHEKSSDRQQLLRQILDMGMYGEVGKAARVRAKEAQSQRDILEQQLAAAPVVTAAQAKKLEADHKKIEAACAAVPELVAAATAAGDEVTEAQAALDELQAAVELLQDVVCPDEVETIGAQLDAADKAMQEATAHESAARAAVEAANAACAAGPEASDSERLLELRGTALEVGEELAELVGRLEAAKAEMEAAAEAAEAARAQLAEADAKIDVAREARAAVDELLHDATSPADIEALLAQHAGLLERREQLPALEDAASSAATELHAAEELASKTDAALTVAQATFDRARKAAGAAGLAKLLETGQPCPVCRQNVHELPDHDHDEELAAAEQAEAEAREAQAAADKAVRERQKVATDTEAARAGHAAAIEKLEAALADADSVADLEARKTEVGDLVRRQKQAIADQGAAEKARTALASSAEISKAIANETNTDERFAEVSSAHTALEARAATLTAQLDGVRTVDELTGDIAEAKRLRDAAAVELGKHREAAQAVKQAKAALDEVTEAEQRARIGFGAKRDTLVHLGPPAASAGRTLLQDWVELAEWAADQAKKRAALQKTAAGAHTKAEKALAKAEASLAKTCSPFIDDPTPATAMVEMTKAQAAAQNAAVQAREHLAEVEARREQIKALAEREQVATKLGSLLRTDGFEDWLMAEVIADLASRATDRLFELSGGQYSLVADGTGFQVRDHRNADELRGTKTLSGGETFLASLALALALADNIAEMGSESSAQIGSIFLDEGFGTLDTDTLDVVAAAIEELGASGRLVGIVTHIAALAARMPVRLEVSKNPTTATVERVES